jgi:hypothetical protein
MLKHTLKLFMVFFLLTMGLEAQECLKTSAIAWVPCGTYTNADLLNKRDTFIVKPKQISFDSAGSMFVISQTGTYDISFGGEGTGTIQLLVEQPSSSVGIPFVLNPTLVTTASTRFTFSTTPVNIRINTIGTVDLSTAILHIFFVKGS